MSNELNSISERLTGNFLIGDRLTLEQAQGMIDAGQGENVYESKYGRYHIKEWLDGQHSLLNNVSTKAAQSNSTNSDVDNRTKESTSTATSLQISPEVIKLEELANQLEAAADDLKAKYNNAAVDDFEAAAGKVARAAEEVRENPTSEAAIEEFETATDELKNTAHALEGEIGDEQYQKIVSAVDEFETTTDHMLAADDGEADMASAMSKASNALESLVEATTGRVLPDKGEVLAAETYSELNKLSNKLNSLISSLMDKFGINDNLAMVFEEATEQFEEAIDVFNADPTSEVSIEGLEKAADALKGAITGLKGHIDDSTYQGISKTIDALEEAIDKLAGLDGQQDKVDKVASEIAQVLKEVIRAISEGIEGGRRDTQADDTVPASTLENLRKVWDQLASTVDASTENNLKKEVAVATEDNVPSVNQDDLPGEATSGNSGPLPSVNDLMDKVGIDDLSVAVKQLDEAIDTFNADPTSESSIEGLEKAADGLKQATAGLEDKLGDDSTYQALSKAVNGLEEAVDKLAGLDGQQAEVDEVTAKITSALEELINAVTKPNDVAVHTDDLSGQPFPGNTGVETPDVINDDILFDSRPIPSVFSSGADRVETMATNLKRSAIDIAGDLNMPELNQFEAAADRLEAAADTLAIMPKDKEAINEFKAAAKELQDVTHALDGKIQGGAYEKAASAVDDLVDAAERVREQSTDGREIFFNNNPALNDAATAISKLDNVVNFDLKSDSGPIFIDEPITLGDILEPDKSSPSYNPDYNY